MERYNTVINSLTVLLKNLARVKPYTLMFVLTMFGLHTYKVEVVNIINTKVLNKDRIVHGLGNDLQVSKSLKGLMSQANADRAYIFRFHNGITYYNGTHKNKFSCDYEVTEAGIARVAETLQDIPVTLYPDFIDSVINNEMFYCDIEEMEDLVSREELRSQGVRAVAVAPYYRNGNLFAMIGVDYIKDVGDIEAFNRNKEIAKKMFRDKTDRIGALLP